MIKIICPECGRPRFVVRIRKRIRKCRECGLRDGAKKRGGWISKDKKKKIICLIRKNLPYRIISERTGTSKPSICRIAALIGYHRPIKKWDWERINIFYLKSRNAEKTIKHFNIPRYLWWNMKKNGIIRSRYEDVWSLLKIGRKLTTSWLKEKLIENGILEDKCSVCGITEWMGGSISLHLHHINGNRCDNRLENLKICCPNCHSQTDSYAGKNIKKLPLSFNE